MKIPTYIYYAYLLTLSWLSTCSMVPISFDTFEEFEESITRENLQEVIQQVKRALQHQHCNSSTKSFKNHVLAKYPHINPQTHEGITQLESAISEHINAILESKLFVEESFDNYKKLEQICDGAGIAGGVTLGVGATHLLPTSFSSSTLLSSLLTAATAIMGRHFARSFLGKFMCSEHHEKSCIVKIQAVKKELRIIHKAVIGSKTRTPLSPIAISNTSTDELCKGEV